MEGRQEATQEQVIEFLRSLPPEERVEFLRTMIAACEHNDGAPPDPETLATIEQFKLEHGTGGPDAGENWSVVPKGG